MSHTTEESGFARVGSTRPLGAFDAQLERINMHTQTIDILRGQAACNGLNLSEFLRLHLESLAYGVEGVQRMHSERVRRILTNAGA